MSDACLGKRLGEVVTLPYNGDLFTALDGTVWKAQNLNPLAYTSKYAALLTDAPLLVTSAVLLPGPFTGGTWQGYSLSRIVGATNGTWLMMPSLTTLPDVYFTSTDQGQTWTQRTPPVAGKVWNGVLWDGTNFVIYANGTGATGVQESTDGINWTARTAISLTVADTIFNGSVYLAIQSGSATCATSPDRATWTSRTATATPSFSTTANVVGLGNVTWNAGAGLFVMATSTSGQYQTSPDGATWTTRTTFDSVAALCTAASIKFASDGTTTTVVAGLYGVVAYSTDCVNWTAVNVDTNLVIGATTPIALYWDGSRFVLLYVGLTYYSTNGTTWTRAAQGNMVMFNNAAIARTPIGLLGRNTSISSNTLTYHLTDVTSATNTNIVMPGFTADTNTRAYMRIL